MLRCIPRSGRNIGHEAAMTILVTGGAGYIGSHMVLELLDSGESVVVLDNLSTGFRWAVPGNATLVVGDIGDQELVRSIVRKHGVKSIIHFAGSIVVPESVVDPLGYYHNNTAKSRALMEVAVEMGIENFIFSSTAAVYGMPKEIPVREDAALAPMSPYGSSKLMTEIMLADTARAHNFRYVALRYFNVAGADPKGRSGQSTPHATHLIKVACETALGKRPYMEVFGTDYETPDGTCIRDYIHVTDLVRAHMAALAPPARRRQFRDLQLRLLEGLLGAAGDRRRKAHVRRRFRGAHVATPAGRSGGHRRRLRQDPRAPRLASRVRQSRDDHGAGAGLGSAFAAIQARELAAIVIRGRKFARKLR